MKDILAAANEGVLAQLAWSNALVAFDFDGTLAPIVDDPHQAAMSPRTRDLMERLCKLYPCIVISGRAQADVLKRTRGVGLREAIGNHGLEPWRWNEGFAAMVQSWVPRLQEDLAGCRGVEVEDKGFSIAVHYRRSREKKLAKKAILDAAKRLGPLRVVGGKMVINLIPDGAPHKGMALRAARDRLGCDTALYVGDDETDEDVFSLDEPGRLLTVRVGASRQSRAAFYVDEQRMVDELIAALIALRPSREGRKVHAR